MSLSAGRAGKDTLMLVSPVADTLDDVDFVPVLPCEDGQHHTSTGGCVAEESGAFYMVAPCCGGRAVICAGRHGYLTGPTVARIGCGGCRLDHPPERYRYIPITEA